MAYKPPTPIMRMQAHIIRTIEQLQQQVRTAEAQIQVLQDMRSFCDTAIREAKVKF